MGYRWNSMDREERTALVLRVENVDRSWEKMSLLEQFWVVENCWLFAADHREVLELAQQLNRDYEAMYRSDPHFEVARDM